MIADFENDAVTIVDLASRRVAGELDLRPGKNDPAQSGKAGGEFPYWVAVRGNDRAYISSVRDREVVVVDLSPKPVIAARIGVHGQPNKMALNRAQTLLYVSEDNSDTLAVIDTANNKILGELGVTAPADLLGELNGFSGSSPNSILLSHDERTAYLTLGGANAVAVVALDGQGRPSEVTGLIPTAWYPTSATLDPSEKTLYVSNGKSNPSGPNAGNCRDTASSDRDALEKCHAQNKYILQLMRAGLLSIPLPGIADLRALTDRVVANNRWHEIAASNAAANSMSGLRGKVHHVIYIVKENRSYDQVLGDLEKGNGDPKLAILPEAISPNHHQLARQFVTLDNLLASGEVSGDGWNWSTSARGTDSLEKGLPVEYNGSRQLSYDYEGQNRNMNVGIAGVDARKKANPDTPDDPDLLPGTADLIAPDGPGGPGENAGAGYLWDSAIRAHVSLRNYGFFLDLARYDVGADSPTHISAVRDAFAKGIVEAYPDKPALANVTDPYFPGFDLKLPDYWRFKEWEREFDGYVGERKFACAGICAHAARSLRRFWHGDGRSEHR